MVPTWGRATVAPVTAWIGTSGWTYDDWRGTFYPDGTPRRRWLAYYATRFPTVEVNGTFYRLPSTATVRRWAASVPDGFRFAIKVSRYLTHVRRLRESDGVTTLLARLEPLEGRLAPFLVQLPPRFLPDAERLVRFLDAFDGMQVAVEPRDVRWFAPEIRRSLEAHGAALVWSDYPGSESPPWITADFLYVRRHGTSGRFAGRYGTERLRSLATQIEETGRPSYCYFNNDIGGAAPLDAAELQRLLAGAVRLPGKAGSGERPDEETDDPGGDETDGNGPPDP